MLSLVLTMAATFGCQKWNARAVLAHHLVFVANIRTSKIVPKYIAPDVVCLHMAPSRVLHVRNAT